MCVAGRQFGVRIGDRDQRARFQLVSVEARAMQKPLAKQVHERACAMRDNVAALTHGNLLACSNHIVPRAGLCLCSAGICLLRRCLSLRCLPPILLPARSAPQWSDQQERYGRILSLTKVRSNIDEFLIASIASLLAHDTKEMVAIGDDAVDEGAQLYTSVTS
jgi:hypothetical protein